MSNMINVNYTSRVINNYLNKNSRKSGTETMERTFIKAKSGKTDSILSSSTIRTVSREEMTMEEYKSHIYDQISSFKIDPSRAHDSYSINISEAGFAAMKDDPEYEAWVLDYIKRDMAVAAPGWYTAMGGPSAYCVLNFGATKEERSGQMVSAGYQNGKGKSIFDAHAKDSFWSNRNDVQKAYNKQAQKKAEAKKRQEKAMQKELMEERLQYQQVLQEYLSSRYFSDQQSVQNGVTISSIPISSATSSYEASFLIE